MLDYESRFRDQVIDSFAASYIAGETPVPCVACNQTVKFADLLGTAKQLGAAALATGHYVMSKAAGNHRVLFRPADIDRDQSYFLFATTQEQLDFVRFPLGTMTKPEVRAAAREFGLSVADKHDSQDICFVPNGKYTDVIERLRPDAATAATSSTSTGACSGGTPALSTIRSASGAESASPPASRSTSCISIRRDGASSSVRARRSRRAVCTCAR